MQHLYTHIYIHTVIYKYTNIYVYIANKYNVHDIYIIYIYIYRPAFNTISPIKLIGAPKACVLGPSCSHSTPMTLPHVNRTVAIEL